MAHSTGESTLLLHLRAGGHPAPVCEHRFHPTRKWRFDFAWPALMVAVEVEGGVFARTTGRHQRGAAFAEDCRKYNEATRLGWRVYRFTTEQVESGEAVRFLEGVLA